MTTLPAPLSRRERDRLGAVECARAASAMFADAAGYRAIAEEAKANPDVYGSRAEEYAAGIAARYMVIAAFCEHEAQKQQGYADDYRAALMERRP